MFVITGLFLQIYIGVTDHLWGRHCQRDFKDSKLQEYESWKEMYIRLSEERERKFKRLTKSIVSAHSKKPRGADCIPNVTVTEREKGICVDHLHKYKFSSHDILYLFCCCFLGRQVKMAFIHTVAKPPRDVRIQQEIHGTAVQQPHQKCRWVSAFYTQRRATTVLFL